MLMTSTMLGSSSTTRTRCWSMALSVVTAGVSARFLRETWEAPVRSLHVTVRDVRRVIGAAGAGLWQPEAHEPLAGGRWDSNRARNAIAAICHDAETAFDPDALWPAHPLDGEVDDDERRSLYL